MLSNLQIINPLDYKDWDVLLAHSQRNSFFHSTAWLRVLKESYNYKPCYFVIMDNTQLKVLVPMVEVNTLGMQKRGISLPFTDYCPIIFNAKYNFSNIQHEIQDYGRSKRWKYLEFRDDKYFKHNDTPAVSFYQHSLQLESDSNCLFNKFNSVTKRNIRKALRERVKIKIGYAPDFLENYYRLHCITRKRHGLPPQPLHFFYNIYKYIFKKNKGTVFLVSFKDQYIAGMIFFHFAKEAIYKYGASLKNYQNLRPNNLLMWEAIKWYINRGYQIMNLGRTELHHEGLRNFKNGWHPIETIHHYYKYNLVTKCFCQQRNLNNQLTAKVIKLLPINVLKLMGNLTYKYIG
jgi:lipid II:glycine glycyltransferase (peptidoglycan interpeptide bridge formation enzyme)